MTDNELIKLFVPILDAGLIARGFSGVSIVQSNQPTIQGINNAPTIYFFKAYDRRYGFLHRYAEWKTEVPDMVQEEIQYMETTFQVSALVLQDVNDTDTYTASDLVNEAASILQSDVAIDALRSGEVGILRITDIRNPYFKDDRDIFEASPNFDFTLSHKQVSDFSVPVINSINLDIHRI